jgi:hypothetical protein
MTDQTTPPHAAESAAVRPLGGLEPAPAGNEPPETPTEPQTRAHGPAGRNAEDCPGCDDTNPPYPWICPGDDRYKTATRASERPAGADAGTETADAPTGRQAGAGGVEKRRTVDTITDDDLDALYDRLERAEAALDRARRTAVELECQLARAADQLTTARALLAEAGEWAPDGLADQIRTALDITTEDPMDRTHRAARMINMRKARPPARPQATEPGDTREQLPDHLLAHLAPLPDYLSTACQAAEGLACDLDHPHASERNDRAEQLHGRCRLNNKFTGQLCICDCHRPGPVQSPGKP